MKSFLQIVTEDIVRKHGTDLSNVVVVFPNKRASLFMNQCFVDIVDKPLFSPQYMTMSELFRSQSKYMVADDIRSICALYKIYQSFIPSEETIDAFWGWGEVLLSDFDDIDKHLGNAKAILSNVRDLHAYDTIDYLTEEQKTMLKRFFAEFSEDHDSRLKERFLNLWNKLLDIYQSFNEALKEKNLIYEGAMYREVALRAKDIDWGEKKYIFVGFNLLWEAEQQLFSALKENGLAYFYWDFDHFYTDDVTQEAGHSIRKWLKLFPNELDANDISIYNNFSTEKDITYLSASSENIQARYIGQWLTENGRLDEDKQTAIVLADESLLKSVIYYLPQEASGKANITIGFPLHETPITSFVNHFLHLHIYYSNVAEQTYTLRQVKTLLSHPYIDMLLPEGEWRTKLMARQSIMITAKELCIDEPTTLLFTPIDITQPEANTTLLERLMELLRLIGETSEHYRTLHHPHEEATTPQATYEEQMMQESVFQMYTKLNRISEVLSNEEITLSPRTLNNLIVQVTMRTSMPFHGEPIASLQITGMLETRNLDFDHLLILSANEGNIPRGILSTTLLPYIVRKAYGLTTPEDKVAVYAYNFYRLLQRCGDISMAFNASTEDGKTGEMSRFMLQIMAETSRDKFHLVNKTLTAEQIPSGKAITQMDKTPEIMAILHNFTSLSPSSINRYLRCPMQFYYINIAGKEEPEADTIDDNRMMGTIFHNVVEAIYSEIIKANNGVVTEEAIDRILNDKEPLTIRDYIDASFSKNLFRGEKIYYDGLHLIHHEVIYHQVVSLLNADKTVTPFKICGLEQPIYGDFSFVVGSEARTIQLGGFIDRLDCITSSTPDGQKQEVLRVVDYKTGSSMQGLLSNVDAVFDRKNIKKHSDYYLQAMLYSMLVRHSQQSYSHGEKEYEALNKGELAVQPALLFVLKEESRKDPVLKFGTDKANEPITDIINHEKEFREYLQQLIAEMFDPEKPFTQTPFDDNCKYCDFKSLCHKTVDKW